MVVPNKTYSALQKNAVNHSSFMDLANKAGGQFIFNFLPLINENII